MPRRATGRAIIRRWPPRVFPHARRNYVDVVEAFPEEVAFVLHTLRAVFHTDAQAKRQGLSPAERLLLHQKESGPRMKALQDWMARRFAEHTVEPHSGLGQAISYMQNHWEKLSLFLRVPGAPLDNNITERILKRPFCIGRTRSSIGR
ncbi:MAG: transposase [Candidatus Accumulibacter sp.]|uniref:Transposase n=1 Tax=Candidatus Accumulibacter proximus TaxID=2954385 RepID=A0A935Q0T9_9PROT|nr:transposase [Candidatus Accumulibacter proximus]